MFDDEKILLTESSTHFSAELLVVDIC